MTIDIIGAGIGGLTTAIALEQKGIKTRIFEQTKELMPVGAGIILASNAMQVYEKFGLRKEIEDQGNYVSAICITKANLRPISKVDLTYFEKKHRVKNVAIHRGALQKILVNALKSSEIHLNHRLSSIESNTEGNLLTFENGEQIQSSVLIGADGINSIVRKKMFSAKELRNAEQICWRGVTEFNLPEKYQHEINEAWNKKNRFGFVQIAKNKVYWYALKSHKRQGEFDVNEIESYFRDYNPLIKEIIAATKKSQINTAEILDIKPTSDWHTDKVCLIGDAAHATTPNMGQGACQAIEDAYVIGEYLNKFDPNMAFKKFQETRLPKAHQIVKTSWMIGKIAHLSNPVFIALRNFFIRLTAPFNRKLTAKTFRIPKL